MKDVLGLIVTGGDGLLAELGVPEDAALTPFAGKYRFIDFALATLVNSDVASIHVASPRPRSALRTHLAAAACGVRAMRRPLPFTFHDGSAGGRAERVLRALLAWQPALEANRPDGAVALTADHVLQLDLRRLLDAHRRLRADVTLCTASLPWADAGNAGLDVDSDGCVRRVASQPEQGLTAVWTGDLVVRAQALPALYAIARAPEGGDAELLRRIGRVLRVAAYDVLDNQVPGDPGAFWHDPASLEAYYDAQMNLCTPRPALDLYEPRWPVRPVASPLGPAKVTADAAGRQGQTLNALVSDGAIVRGGVVLNTVLGHGVLVESGAEIEDSVLLDGCRIGRGARVRRAMVGVGAVIGDAGEIGYGRSPVPPARVLPSGLTIVSAIVERPLAVAAGAAH